jgi:hypothetical protein
MKDCMQPDKITWDEFTARRTAPETGEETSLPKLARNKRPEPALSVLLLQAIHLAGALRGRLSKAERIREATLLEVLSTAMRSAR